MSTVPYKAFRHFNHSPPQMRPGSRSRPGDWSLDWFAGETRECRLARALLAARAVPFKELLESFESFERMRKVVRGRVVADLCCGHGLTGMLYGVFHRDVERVVLVDRKRPDSVDACLAALAPLAPWLAEKVEFRERALEAVSLPEGTAVLGIHACGAATDAVIDVALGCGGPVGLLPCCHAKALLPGPATLGRALGVSTATDIHRTYRLEAAGRRVRWSEIPAAITPMNRIILGW
jgi:hypothetical protein